MRLSERHVQVLYALDSRAFPEPTARTLGGWTFVGSEAAARRLLRPLVAWGLVERHGRPARHRVTEAGRQARAGRLFGG